jgi:transcriptional regulator with XRE-family HTH domain
MNISDKLNQYKEDKNLSWEDLADKLDISTSLLWGLRHGEQPATIRVARHMLALPDTPFMYGDFFNTGVK